MNSKKSKSSRSKKAAKADEAKKTEEKTEEKSKRMTIQEKYKLLEHEIQAIMDQKLRLAAEFDNFRRRTNEEKADWIKNATQRLVLEICDVLDNFERALNPDHGDKDAESFREGVDLIFKQLLEVLKREGVEKIESLGSKFDPNFHDALAHVPSEEKENTIVAVIQNGYKMNQKVIRPARVAVSNGEKPVPQKQEKTQSEQDKIKKEENK